MVGVDNFITGRRSNIEPFVDRMEFVEGDIRDADLCGRLCQGVDYVLHEAALGSVPRSVADPATTNDHNVNGTLNIFVAAKNAKVKRVVYAASSSAYGNTATLPKVESMPANPLSPYAVSKYVSELYGRVFSDIYGLGTVGLRYFNVFGRRQDPNGTYAAVIPRFILGILDGQSPIIFGDGGQTRDFTYIDNVIQANLKACQAGPGVDGKVYNVGAGGRVSILDLARELLTRLGSGLELAFQPPREGDVRDSQASIEEARADFGYEPEVDVATGLGLAIDWYRAQRVSTPSVAQDS